jgi:hypothetical protein
LVLLCHLLQSNTAEIQWVIILLQDRHALRQSALPEFIGGVYRDVCGEPPALRWNYSYGKLDTARYAGFGDIVLVMVQVTWGSPYQGHRSKSRGILRQDSCARWIQWFQARQPNDGPLSHCCRPPWSLIRLAGEGRVLAGST